MLRANANLFVKQNQVAGRASAPGKGGRPKELPSPPGKDEATIPKIDRNYQCFRPADLVGWSRDENGRKTFAGSGLPSGRV